MVAILLYFSGKYESIHFIKLNSIIYHIELYYICSIIYYKCSNVLQML